VDQLDNIKYLTKLLVVRLELWTVIRTICHCIAQPKYS